MFMSQSALSQMIEVKSTLWFLLVFFFVSLSLNGQNPPQITTLELNKPLEREISGTQRHSYQINLSANQYLKILLQQQGIDLGLRLYGTDGKQISDFDAEFKSNGSETVEFIAPKEGNYRFDIINKFTLMPAGKYEIKLAELRLASEKDVLLQEARNLHSESIRFFNAGKYSEARQSIEKSFEINQKELGLENQTVVINLTQLGRNLAALGDYKGAEKVNLQALAIEQKIFEPNHPHTANTLNYLASVYAQQESFPKAVEHYQKAFAMREEIYGKFHPTVAISLINLGVVHNTLGDNVKAIEVYEKALNILEKTSGTENLNFAVVLNNIGKIYNETDEYKKAETYLVRAVAILEKLYQPDNPRIFDVLTNLASSHIGMRNVDKAEALFQRIVAAREKSFGENHPLTAHALYNLGNLSALKNDFAKAEQLYLRALEIRKKIYGNQSTTVSEVLSSLALLLANKGEIEQSLKLQEQANEIDEQNIGFNLTIGSERQKLAYLNSLFERTNQSLLLQTKYAAENPLAIGLAATTVLRQKGRVLDAVANNLSELHRRSSPQDKELLDKFNKITREISELNLSGAEEISISEHQQKIKTLIDEREKLEDEISRRVAGFFPKSKPVTLPLIQSAIPNDFVLLEFAAYSPDSSLVDNPSFDKQRYIVYVLQNQSEIKWKDLGQIKQIDDLIDSFRQALSNPEKRDLQQIARQLDEKIMKPVRSLIGNTKKLFVSPDGNLNLIPFEALIDEQNRYLVENYSFTYLSSGRDLLRMQVVKESKNKPLLVANPAFGEPDSMQTLALKRQSITTTRNLTDTYFAPLSGTIQEARSIQTLFPEAEVLSEKRATETTLKQINAPKILHIATHGFFLENINKKDQTENPLLRSGLALAGANQRKGVPDDGVLTALEASGLNLWGTKLVVLSACDTGLGEVKNGEGVYGLRRAFVLAGTETLVMSLWSVSDLVTRELMTGYYKNLKAGIGRGESLRQVQLEMLKKTNRRHPFYWASFIQSGDWRELESNQ